MKKIYTTILFILFTSFFSFGQSPGNLDFNWKQNFISGVGSEQVVTVCVQEGGGMIVGGIFNTRSNINHRDVDNIIRINASGFIDTSFGRKTRNSNGYFGANGSVNKIILDSNGKILVGGYFTQIEGQNRRGIARLNTDGSVDTGFNTVDWDQSADDIVIQPDGKILIAGSSSTDGTQNTRKYVYRLNANGTLDLDFNSGVNYNVYRVALQPDGKILIAGQFTEVDGVARNKIARLNADGSLDESFNPGAGANGIFIRGLVLQPDGKIIIGGDFTLFNNLTKNRIVRLNNDGSIDETFNVVAGANNSVLNVALHSDGKILVLGAFTTFNNVSKNRIVRLRSDGSIDSTFDIENGANGNVRDAAFQSYTAAFNQKIDRIIVGGDFTTFDNDGTKGNRMASLVRGPLEATLPSILKDIRENEGKLTNAKEFNEVLVLTDVTTAESDKLKKLISDGAEVETVSDLRELLDQIRKLEAILTDIRSNDGENTDASDFNEVLGLTDITEEESNKLKDLISEGAEVETVLDLRELLDQIRKLEEIVSDIRTNDGANTDETDFNEVLGLTDVTEAESDKLKDLIQEGADVETILDLRELLDQIRKLEEIVSDIRTNDGANTDASDFNEVLGLTDITEEESNKLKDLISEGAEVEKLLDLRELLDQIRKLEAILTDIRSNDGENTDASDFNEVLGLTDITEEESDKLKDLILDGAEIETVADLRSLLEQIRNQGKLEEILTDIRINDATNTDETDFNEVLGLTDLTKAESDKLKDLIQEGADVETISDLRELLDQIRKLEEIISDISDNDGANTDAADFDEVLGLTDVTEAESDKLKDLISEGAEVETVSDLRELLDQIRKLDEILNDIRTNDGADTDETDFNELLGLTDITEEESDKLKDLILDGAEIETVADLRSLLEQIRNQEKLEEILNDIRTNDGANTDATDFNEVLGLTDVTEEESEKLKDLISEGAEVETVSDLRELSDQIRKLEEILNDIRTNDGANTDAADFNEVLGLTDITEEESDKLKDLMSEDAEVETISDLRELLDQVRLENSLPEAPTGLWVSPQDGALQINFTEGNEGDSPILNYQYTLDGGQTWLDFSPAVIGSPLTITGLDNGTAYDIQIRALNATGEGVPSERISATTGSQAFTYTMTWNNISGSYAGNSFTDQTLTFTFLNVLPDDFVDWITPNSRVVFPNGEKVKITLGDILINVPLDNIESNTIFLGAIDTYIFLSQINGYNRGGLQGFSPNPPSSSKLTSFWQSSASEAYFANQILWSPFVINENVLNITFPNPPTTGYWAVLAFEPSAPDMLTNVIATPKDGAVEISFTAGFDGGNPISNYEYSLDEGVTWMPFSPEVTTSPVTIPNLINGTAYEISLRSLNGLGSSPAIAAINVTPATTPSQLSNMVTTPQDGAVEISFVAGSDGGSPITKYEYSLDEGQTWISFDPAVTSSPATITGLTNGTAYNISLRAINSQGVSPVIVTDNMIVPGSPSFTSTPAITIPYGEPYNYTILATTENNLTTRLASTTLPAWLDIVRESTAKPFVSLASARFISVAGDTEGNIYAIVPNGEQIYKWLPDLTPSSWKSGMLRTDLLVGSIQIANGYIYISRNGNSIQSITRVPLNDPSAQEEVFASTPNGVVSLAYKDGFIYASNRVERQILKINETTKEVEVLLSAVDGISTAGLWGLTFDNSGSLYISTFMNNSILKYDGTNLTTVLSLPRAVTSIVTDKNNDFYLAIPGEGIRKYTSDFSSYQIISPEISPGQSFDVRDMSITPSGDLIYVKYNTSIIDRLKNDVSIMGTPTKDDVGEHPVVLRASNEFGFTEQSFTITVTDDIAPQISTLLPSNNVTDVSLQPTLTITFDEEVVLGDTGTLTVNNGSKVLRTYDLSLTEDRTEFILSEDSKTLSVELDVELPIKTVITIGITPGFVSDMSDNTFAGFEASSETWSFTTIFLSTITSAPSIKIPYGQPYNYTISTTSEVGGQPTLAVPTLPAWLSFEQKRDTLAREFAQVSVPQRIVRLTAAVEDSEGNIYAIQSNGEEIFKIQPNGNISSWKSGMFVATPGFVYSLVIANGYIYIARYLNNIQSITRVPLNNPSAQEEIFASIQNGVSSLFYKNGYFYASNNFNGQVFKINEKTRKVELLLSIENGIPERGPWGMTVDNSGNLYIATFSNKSILKFDGITLRRVLSDLPANVTSILADENNDFYLSMYGGGVRKYTSDFRYFRIISQREDDEVFSMSITPHGDLIYPIHTNNLLYRFKAEPLNVLMGTPAKDDVGEHPVVLRASNEFGFTEQSFTITVTDDIAPQILTLLPANNTTDVALQPTLTITFDEEVVLGDTGTLTVNDGNAVLRTYDLSLTEDRTALVLSDDNKTLSVELDVSLPINTAVTIGITSGFVSDMSDNDLEGFEAGYGTWSFTTINKLEQTITFPEITTKTYGDPLFVLGDSITERGLTITYTAIDPSVVSISGNQATILKAGSTTIKATQAGDEFTFAAESVERTLEINQASLQILASNKSKIYGSSNPILTFSYKGLVNGDSKVATEPSISTTATASSGVGTYPFTLTGGEDPNYAITLVAGELEVTKATLTITADNQSKVYDLEDPEFTYVVNGLVGSDQLSGKLSRNAGEEVGKYAITLGTLTGGNNYQIAYTAAELEIIPTSISEIFEIGTLEMNWGSVPNLPARVALMATNGRPYFLDVTWNESTLNRFRRGTYDLEGEVTETAWIKNQDDLKAGIKVTVLPKPAPEDILLSNNTFEGARTSQEVAIGALSVVDPIDNIHVLGVPYDLEDNRYFKVINDVLYWSSEDPAAGRTKFKVVVRVTDRDFNTLDKVFEIIRTRKSVNSIEVFNTFTPEGDGKNDTWGVPDLRYYSGVRIQIFDRGGDRLFYTENPDIRWDGNFKGKELPIGTYYWTIEVGETGEVRKGMLNLLRK